MILVTGAKGQLGISLVKELQRNKCKYTACSREDFDITSNSDADKFISNKNPRIVIHCAAYTDVDKAEENEKLCHDINYNGTKNIAQVCKRIGATLVLLSSDYVFDGKKKGPYEVSDDVNPLSVYGKSKSLAEAVVKKTLDKYFIFRTSWLFGEGRNFVRAILKQKNEKYINVVGDQIGSPTFSDDLAACILKIIDTEIFGTYHITNSGFCSFAQWAEQILQIANSNTEVIAVPTEFMKQKVKRPLNSCLSSKSLKDIGCELLPSWEDALCRYMQKEHM